MKKLALTLSFLSFISFSANASTDNIYAGIDLQRNTIGLSMQSFAFNGGSYSRDIDDYHDTTSQNFPSIYVGYSPIENLSTELSYSFIKTDKVGSAVLQNGLPISIASKMKIHNIGLDLKPKISKGDLTAFGILGINLIDANFESKYSNGTRSDNSKTKAGASIGAGAEYRFAQNLSARIQMKYTRVNLKTGNTSSYTRETLDDIISTSVGLKYNF